MISETVVELSRAQFALHAVQYFLFVPLTLGLSLLLAAMDSWFVFSGQSVYQRITQFWGKLFAIGFGLNMASSLVMASQFGSHWSYFAHYVGDVFALPLLLGFAGLFIAANGLGWFLFGWQRLGKGTHLAVTWLIAIGCHLSFFGFLIASGWMQNPVGAELNTQTLRLELLDVSLVLSNPLAWAKFVHSLLAGYVVAAGFVLAISAYYLLKQRETELAQRSYRMAAALGLASVIATMAIGDASVYGAGAMQHNKLAAINGLPNAAILAQNRQRIGNGIKAYALLQELRDDKKEPELLAAFAAAKVDLGYGLLLKRWRESVTDASPAQIEQAVSASVPASGRLYWGYRLMIAAGALLALLFVAANAVNIVGWQHAWLFKASVYALPLPWLASASGWFISEFGRQPWLVADMLPIWQGVSTLAVADLAVSLAAYGLTYAGLLALAVMLTLKFIGQGCATALPINQEPSYVA
ncbi:cytochrome ubiquinol oxidase subunit I [Methylomonas sp. ZR1]|uniref:cytochrome ubiquinol oxidase subunit I n=1 Tax=Methylomonas sp. ZR1 TaxID=1797072 RepID=UPI0014912807|nr:cytochrome ubiquinol oxidase subunit I [Methylomonas sp. ZR1]NOV31322.1 cytochrome bd-I ubiquinol oxidase subunit CydA [Methylomonas sp. ZR1]